MQVLIPHPTELISLAKLQKRIIQENYNSDCLLTRFLPLWIDFPHQSDCELTKNQLKNAASKIKKIEIQFPVVSSDKTLLYCPVKLTVNETQLETSLKLIKIHNPDTFQLKKISTEDINFPLCLKIFRLGNKIELPEQNAQAIQDFVWKKL